MIYYHKCMMQPHNAKQLLHAQLSKYERHLFFCDGISFWSSHTAVAVELAGCRCREGDQCWACSSEIWGVWSQLALSTAATPCLITAPCQHRADVFLCPILCSSALCPKRVDMGPAWQSFEKQYPSNWSTVTKRTVICVYWITPERSLWEQWYVTDVLRRY